MNIIKGIVAGVLLTISANASALLIEYDLIDFGAGNYRYEYTATNDGSIGDIIGLFGINFDPALYDELSLTPVLSDEVTSNWDGVILGSAPGLPAVLDMFAFGAELGLGETLSGFGVDFTWLGDDAGPGAQSFEIFDSWTFDFLGDGFTVAAVDDVVGVPEPGSLALLVAGLGMLGARRRLSRGANQNL